MFSEQDWIRAQNFRAPITSGDKLFTFAFPPLPFSIKMRTTDSLSLHEFFDCSQIFSAKYRANLKDAVRGLSALKYKNPLLLLL